MIYISTGGYPEQAAWRTSVQFLEAGLYCVELSGGFSDDDQMRRIGLLKHTLSFQIHNYFPPPKNPFVFNLASLNKGISILSYQHVLTAMHLAIELNLTSYSFHAGFLLDPQMNELGQCIQRRELVARKQALVRFVDQVNDLSEYARKLGISLLIENNVLTAKNYREFSADPFLMTTAEECAFVMRNTPNNVNLLIDVAHLKVSAHTLGFDPVEFLSFCAPWIRAYHLSDNDGKSDSNKPIDKTSWFWSHLKRGLEYYSLEIYNVPLPMLVQQHQLTQQKLTE